MIIKYKENIELSLVTVFFFSVLNPFLSFYPAPTDVQPLVFFLSLLIVFRDVINKQFNLSKSDFIFILFALFAFGVINIYSEFSFKNRMLFMLAFTVYYASKNNLNKFNPKILNITILINFIFVIMNDVNFYIYETIVENLIREVKIDFSAYQGSRGLSGLTPEPSYLSGISSAYFMLLYYFRKKGLVARKLFYILSIMCLYMLIATKSGTGMIILMLLLLFMLSTINFFKSLILVVLLIASFSFSGGVMENSRIVKLIEKSIYTDNSFSVFLNDTSVARRAAPYYVAAYSLRVYPFGIGGGGYSNVAIETIDNTNIMKTFTTIGTIFVEKVPAALPIYLVEYGFIFLIFLIYILLQGFRVTPLHIFTRLLVIFFMVGSFSIVFPLTWVLLAVVSVKNDEVCKKC